MGFLPLAFMPIHWVNIINLAKIFRYVNARIQISKKENLNQIKRKKPNNEISTQLEKHMKTANEDFLVFLWCSWKVWSVTCPHLCSASMQEKAGTRIVLCIVSPALWHPMQSIAKNHVMISADLSLKVQILNFRKTAPNLSVQVIKTREPGILWQKTLSERKSNKRSSTTKSYAMDASLWESFPQILPVFLAAFLSVFPMETGKKTTTFWVLNL